MKNIEVSVNIIKYSKLIPMQAQIKVFCLARGISMSSTNEYQIGRTNKFSHISMSTKSFQVT